MARAGSAGMYHFANKLVDGLFVPNEREVTALRNVRRQSRLPTIAPDGAGPLLRATAVGVECVDHL